VGSGIRARLVGVAVGAGTGAAVAGAYVAPSPLGTAHLPATALLQSPKMYPAKPHGPFLPSLQERRGCEPGHFPVAVALRPSLSAHVQPLVVVLSVSLKQRRPSPLAFFAPHSNSRVTFPPWQHTKSLCSLDTVGACVGAFVVGANVMGVFVGAFVVGVAVVGVAVVGVAVVGVVVVGVVVVGAPVGAFVGALVGALVGARVGAAEGYLVGAGVAGGAGHGVVQASPNISWPHDVDRVSCMDLMPASPGMSHWTHAVPWCPIP
jgi:hypothetical protein